MDQATSMEPLRAVSFRIPVHRPGLDSLRALATLLVVMLHAAVPYTVAKMPGLTWPVRQTVTSPAVDLLFWGMEGAIMPLFFLLSGYGAAQSLQANPNGFLSSRWRRLGWPLVIAAVVLLPIELYLWMLGWAADDRLTLRRMASLKLGPLNQDLWGLSHLWYLQYLLLYSVLLRYASSVLAYQAAASRNAQSTTAGTLLRSVSNSQALFLGAAAVLWLAPEVIVGFQHSFFPVPEKFVFSGLFFAAGAAEFHRPSRWTCPASTSVVFAGLLLVGILPLLHQQASSPRIGPERLVLAACLAGYAVLMVRTAWQQAISSTGPTSPSIEYLARASFWTYLVHHPLVAIWQIGLRPTEWPALIQFALCTVGTVAMSLASYEVLVRRTWMGELLDSRRPVPQPVETESDAILLRRAA